MVMGHLIGMVLARVSSLKECPGRLVPHSPGGLLALVKALVLV